MEPAEVAHKQMSGFWQARAGKQGESYVGHRDQNHIAQQKRIEDILKSRLTPDTYFCDMLDYGCGYGRFVPFWNNFAGHVWAVDLIPDMLKKAASRSPNVTALRSTFPLKLPIQPNGLDLLWSCLVFQHIVDDSLFYATALELARLLKPGARVLLIDNAIDKAPHVKPRTPQIFARALGLRPDVQALKITINSRPSDHWLIDGYKA